MSFKFPQFTEWNVFKYFLLGILPGVAAINRSIQFLDVGWKVITPYWAIVGVVWMIIVFLMMCWSWK